MSRTLPADVAFGWQRRYIHVMSTSTITPILAPRQFEFGSEWYVYVEWPSGTTQQVGAFKSELLAQAWIQDRSAKWLHDRPALLQHA